MFEYCQLIIDNDTAQLSRVIADQPAIANARIDRDHLFLGKLAHWLYRGDTLLHLAAAGHRSTIIQLLLNAGANPNARFNRRLGAPLHYAADACLNEHFFSEQQVTSLQLLIDAGVCLNAQDKNGGTALHRAVRTRAADAVAFLLKSGADPYRMNCAGSTAFHLAVQTTGRGGSGTPQAKEAQIKIIESFMQIGISSTLRDGRGKTVYDSAQSVAVRAFLER